MNSLPRRASNQTIELGHNSLTAAIEVQTNTRGTEEFSQSMQYWCDTANGQTVLTQVQLMMMVPVCLVNPMRMFPTIAPATTSNMMYSNIGNGYDPILFHVHSGLTIGTASGICQTWPDYGRVSDDMAFGFVAPPSFPDTRTVPNYNMIGSVDCTSIPENNYAIIGSSRLSFLDNTAAYDNTKITSTRDGQMQSSPIGLAQPPLDTSSHDPERNLGSEDEEVEISRSSCAEKLVVPFEEGEEDPSDRVSLSLVFDDTYDASDWNDSCSFVSSDASTVVSHSARRRRGRRAAKARAAQAALSTIPISESRALGDICVTAEIEIAWTKQLEVGGPDRLEALSKIRGSLCSMAFEPFGCRVIQVAFDVVSASDQQLLVVELHGHVQEAVSSPHANFVIQKAIEVLPVTHTKFVAEELLHCAAEVARHRYGCRILCRLVEHSTATVSCLIDKLLLEAETLINHNFARHVIEVILEHGCREQKQRIISAIRNDVLRNAKCRYASYVMEQVLNHCHMLERDALSSDLVSDPDSFLALACHECGSHVIKALLRTRGNLAAHAKELLIGASAQIRTSKFGQRLLDGIS